MKCPVCDFDNLDGARMCEECSMTLSLPGANELIPDKSIVGVIPGILLQNRYLVKKELGAGGMGKIFLAEDKNVSGRLCVVKQNSSDLENSDISQENSKELFFREASLLAQLNYPGIPKVWDYFEEDEMLFLVEEWIDGETLEEKCKDKLVNPMEIIRIFIQLSEILSYIHTRTPMIIHRDIKPQNIIITDNERCYLIDFGISRTYKKGGTRDTINLGTEGYASPELYQGQTDNRSDIYSLGASLWFALTGKDPGQFQWNLPDVKKYRDDVDGELSGIVNKAAAGLAEDRYQKAEEMKCDLEGLMNRTSGETETLIIAHIEEWRQFKGSAQRIGYSNLSVKNKVALIWKLETGEQIISSPIQYGNNILAFSDSGNIYWIHAERGVVLDKRSINHRIRATPVIAGNVLYLGTFDGYLILFDLQKDGIIKSININTGIPSAMLSFSDQVILAGNRDRRGYVFAFDLSGNLKWKVSLSGKCGVSPTYGDRKIFVGDDNGEFYAIDFRTGEILWKNCSPSGIKNTALFVNNKIYVGSGEGNYYSMNSRDGKINWETKVGSEIIGSPSWFEGIVILTTLGGGVHALKEDDGAILWSSREPSTALSPPIFFHERILVSSYEGGNVYCKNIIDGSNLWNICLNGKIVASPLPLRKSFVIQTLEGNLFNCGY